MLGVCVQYLIFRASSQCCVGEFKWIIAKRGEFTFIQGTLSSPISVLQHVTKVSTVRSNLEIVLSNPIVA